MARKLSKKKKEQLDSAQKLYDKIKEEYRAEDFFNKIVSEELIEDEEIVKEFEEEEKRDFKIIFIVLIILLLILCFTKLF